MARLALLLSSFCFLVSACRNSSIEFVNQMQVRWKTERGITTVNNKPFTGILFELNPSSLDTLWVQGFENGKEDGIRKEFYDDGRLKEVRYFKNGKKEGILQSWWPNGKLKSEYYFERGEYEGNIREWNNNGILILSKNYSEGKEEGLQQMWTNTGKVWANYVAKNGRNYGITGIKGCATLWQADSVSAH